MASDTTRSKLRQALTEELIPVLSRSGFNGPATISGKAVVHEFRRPTANGVQVLSIQLEKHQWPRFILVFYIEPTQGMAHVIAHGGTICTGCLTPRTGASSRSWFRADRSWWDRAVLRRTATLEREAVRLCINYLPEVETWWSAQKPSAHIRCWPTTYPGVGEAAEHPGQ